MAFTPLPEQTVKRLFAGTAQNMAAKPQLRCGSG